MASPQSTILVLGGRGKTGSRLIELLLADKVPVIAASRSGSGPAGPVWATFDLLDKSTWPNPFETVKDNALPTISAVYIVVPDAEEDIIRPAGDFIDLALKNGAKRFVF
jgi:festuclavine dehydrogenase